MVDSIPSSRSSIKILNRTGPKPYRLQAVEGQSQVGFLERDSSLWVGTGQPLQEFSKNAFPCDRCASLTGAAAEAASLLTACMNACEGVGTS